MLISLLLSHNNPYLPVGNNSYAKKQKRKYGPMRVLRNFNPLTLISRQKAFLQFLGYAILAELYLPIWRISDKKSYSTG
jgi:hypothetical protein